MKLRTITLILLVITLFSTALSAEYILGVQTLDETAVLMVCIEDKVYADLGDVLIKAIWEVNGEIEHLNCKDYKIWENM